MFKTRVDYVGMSAFGVDFKQKKQDHGGFDNRTVQKLLDQANGFGRLNMVLSRINLKMDELIWKMMGQCMKYDFYLEHIFGDDLHQKIIQGELRLKIREAQIAA